VFRQNAIQFFAPSAGLKIALAPYGFGTGTKRLLVNENPRAPVFRGAGNPSIVLAETLINVGTGSDVPPFCHLASQDVDKVHGGKWRALRDSNSRPSGS
jgi:hypothetical protein